MQALPPEASLSSRPSHMASLAFAAASPWPEAALPRCPERSRRLLDRWRFAEDACT